MSSPTTPGPFELCRALVVEEISNGVKVVGTTLRRVQVESTEEGK